MLYAVLAAIALPTAKLALLLFLLGVFAGFAGARLYARLTRAKIWRFASIRHAGVHVHHVVYGIVIMIVSGAMTFALASDTDWRSFLAFCFGGGTGMVLDEFAIILHVEDVYWSEAGRKSIDAVILTVVATLMLLFGVMPFGSDPDPLYPRSGWALAAVVAFNLVAVVVAGLKGKRLTAALGVFVPLVALLGALTVAHPDSPWARRFYAANPARLGKAERRAALAQSRRHRLHDLIAGTHSTPPEG